MTFEAQAKTILFDALDLPAAERTAFLSSACGENRELRERVERLLEAHGLADDLIGSGDAPIPVAVEEFTASIDLKVGDRVGPYLLEEELGSGGFGVVFRAAQSKPVRRQVALKVLKLGMDTKAVTARFELERQALALMDHPNIARVLDAGATDAGRPYFVMELVDGVAVTQYCDRKQLGVDDRVRLFARVARAVQHAHQRGVLHRDLKPGNVLVAEVDDVPQPKVIDFGIAKATAGELTEASFRTHEGLLLGTPTYMSPEQVDGALDIDTRADVYSLGVLLYELVSGATPFDVGQAGLAGVLQSIREDEPPRPSTRRRRALSTGERAAQTERTLNDVPPELDWIVMRCLEKERERRYATAHDLAQDVERFLANEPLEAAPPSSWYRLRKLVRRHRSAAVAVVGVALALVLGTIGTSIGLVRAERINVQLDAALDDATEANQQLDLALVDARRQTSIAEAVSDFLIQDLLGAARPTGEDGKGPDTTIAELLDVAAGALDAASVEGGRFADKPLVEASLRFTIGTAYDTLGQLEEAGHHVALSAELSAGRDEAQAGTALSYLGVVRRREGLFAESAEIQERALALCTEALGPAAEDTLRAVSRLGNAYRHLGRAAEARDLMEEMLPVAIEAKGPRAAVVTDLSATLAILYAEEGRYGESEELFREVLDAQTELLGPESPVVMNSTMNLATAMRAQGKNDEAEVMYRGILEVQRRVEGPEHRHTMTTTFNLAETLAATGRLADAEEMLKVTAPIVERAYGATHPRAFLWMATRGRLLEEMGRPDEAASMLRGALERARKNLGEGHAITVQAQAELDALDARNGTSSD